MVNAARACAACVLVVVAVGSGFAQNVTDDAAPGNGAPGDDTSGQAGPPAAPPSPPSALGEADRPFVRLLPNLVVDLGRIASKRDNGVTLGIGALASVAAHPLDDHVTRHASAGGTDQMFKVGGIVGNGYLQAGGAVATYVIGRVTGHTRATHVGADLIRGQALAGFVTHGAKLIVRRQRPAGTTRATATFSFPSAHASATWTSATVLWRHLGWKAGVPGALVATFVSGSRIQENQHFLSDVIFGAAIGIAAGRTVTAGHLAGRPVVVAPVPTASGAAIVASVALP